MGWFTWISQSPVMWAYMSYYIYHCPHKIDGTHGEDVAFSFFHDRINKKNSLLNCWTYIKIIMSLKIFSKKNELLSSLLPSISLMTSAHEFSVRPQISALLVYTLFSNAFFEHISFFVFLIPSVICFSFSVAHFFSHLLEFLKASSLRVFDVWVFPFSKHFKYSGIDLPFVEPHHLFSSLNE